LSYLSVSGFALAVGVPARTVRHWLATGRLPETLRTPGGYYRIPVSHVNEFMEGTLPLPSDRELLAFRVAS
jgi:excisionase family DNA binding protein